MFTPAHTSKEVLIGFFGFLYAYFSLLQILSMEERDWCRFVRVGKKCKFQEISNQRAKLMH